MTADFVQHSFAKMGARVKFGEAISERGVSRRELLLDVRIDKRGEYFFIRRQEPSRIELIVLDVQPRDRHLLLLSRNGQDKHRFLFGHDERHWFVAGIPEIAPVSRVQDAKQALKPEAVLISEHWLRAKYRDRRTNAARIRQGEWFFVPAWPCRSTIGWCCATNRSYVAEAVSRTRVKSCIASAAKRCM